MITRKSKYDLVIVGAGLSGFAAAVEAADHGLNALLVEKGRTVGGTGNYVEGMFAVESDYQKQHGINITKKQILKIEQDFTHHTADMRVWRDYVDKSAGNIRWMQKHGVKFGSMRNLGTKGLSVWHIFEGHGFAAIHDGLQKAAESKNIEIVTSTKAVELRLNDNGEIQGIVLETYSDNERQFIQAPYVILATGGFLNSPTLIDRLTDYDSRRVTPMNSGKNTGDGLKLAWSIGAYKAKGFIMSFGGSLKDDHTPAYEFRGTDINNAPTREGLLWVNQLGDRFANEDVSANWGVGGRSLARQAKTFGILDQSQIDYLSENCGPITGKKYAELKIQIKNALTNNAPFLTVAKTIPELAQKIKTPNLQATIQRYNSLCENEKDTDLGKDAKFLVPLKHSPYYAFEFGDGAFCAAGGLRVDPQNCVLSDDGQKIRGLYAVGNDAANVITGDSYDVIVSGAEAGYCIYSGRNAVQAIETETNR